MTSHEQIINDMTYFTDDLSSINENLSNSLAGIELNTGQQDMHDSQLRQQILIEECTLWKKQCNDLTMQKQEIETRSDMLLAESRRLIEEKDNELKHLREITNAVSSTDNQSIIKYEQVIDDLKDENIHLKKSLELQEQTEKDYDEQIYTLQLRIKELEDWNGDFQENDSKQDHSALQLNIDLLTSRNSQLESDLQRLEFQQRNNQLALERLDEYEETISQLQEELDQLRSNKKPQSSSSFLPGNNDDKAISQLLTETRQQSEDKILKLTEDFERQITELNEEVQSLENVNYQLQQQLQSRDQQFQTTPGSPPSVDTQNLSPLNSLYDQFIALLPGEFSSSDNTHLSLSDRFSDLFEQFSSYIGTFSIIQEELDSLKQILNEKQDELEKLRSHLELTTDKLTQLQDDKSSESDDDELEEILGFQQRAPSLQSLLSITPGEKQQLIAQNELLSTLLTEKEQELIELQQAEKTREDLIKNLDILRLNLQQMEFDKEVKQIELNDIRNILDEKLRENSSLKKEKMFFIEKLAQFERERQEIIQIPLRQSTPDREKSPSSIKTTDHISPETVNREEYEKLRSDYDELLELSTRQHDESLSYYNEYTRILTLYNELTTKYSQLQIDYESSQSLVQQKNEAYLQCQNELNTYQNLLYHQKKKSDDIDLLHSTLNEREIQLQKLIDNEKHWLIKQSELELNLKFLEENNSKLISNQKIFEQIQLDLKRITHDRDLAIVEKKQCENQMESKLLQSEERERKLMKEIERLFQLEKSLRDQIDVNNEQSQQVFITRLETFEIEYSKLEEINRNLNEHLIQCQYSLREQISVIGRLTNENNEFRQRFDEEIINKDLLINNLQLEVDLKNKQIIESEENFQTANNSRVEKQLVKNILLSYLHTPINKQQEVVPLIGALVGFTQEEYQKAMDAIANNYNTGGTSWLTGWLSATSSRPRIQSETSVYHSDKSFAELLIQYVDQQSIDNNLQQPILTLKTDNLSEPTSDNATQSII